MTTRDSTPVTPALLRDWALPDPEGAKDSRGRALVVGGSQSTPGAAMLAGIAALRVGAGVLSMAMPAAVAIAAAVAIPEAGVSGWTEGDGSAEPSLETTLKSLLERADALLIGPGLDSAEQTRAILEAAAPLVGSETPVVLDAFALGGLPEVPRIGAELAGRLILTPNSSEAKRLLDAEVDGEEPAQVAARIAGQWDAVVSYAGVVAAPDGASWDIATGHPGLGTSGSGDVLAGAIMGLLARGSELTQAACWGTYLHAASGDRLAARIGRIGFLARELLVELPLVMSELRA